ncbi:MAG: 16S rRNA (uracil(1498)-N(3))-methyltransferase [Planctomycetota bacterium]
MAEPARFYCDNLPAPGLSEPAAVTLGVDESRHARKVRRLEPGDTITLFDGRGRIAAAELVASSDQQAVCRVAAVREVPPPRPRLTVFAATPKGGRAEAMVDQLAQLGADAWRPLASARSVVEPGANKRRRYAAAALAAAKQSGRAWAMDVGEAIGFDAALREPADTRLILDPTGHGETHRRDVFQWESVTLLVGPEGGWTDDERAAAAAAGWRPWCIGPYVLRIETAAVAATALVRYLADP